MYKYYVKCRRCGGTGKLANKNAKPELAESAEREWQGMVEAHGNSNYTTWSEADKAFALKLNQQWLDNKPTRWCKCNNGRKEKTLRMNNKLAQAILNHAIQHGDVEVYNDFAEGQGYELEEGENGVALANWNNHNLWQAAAERLGYQTDWSDEYCSCSNCSKLIRTNPTSYGWQRNYLEFEGEILCPECTDSDTLIEYAKNHASRALTRPQQEIAKLDENGWRKLDREYQSGMHWGQDDDPKVVAKKLREQGINTFIFTIEDVGQFDLTFAVWIPDGAVAEAPDGDQGWSNAGELSAALSGKGAHPHIAKLEYRVPQAAFVAGKMPENGETQEEYEARLRAAGVL